MLARLGEDTSEGASTSETPVLAEHCLSGEMFASQAVPSETRGRRWVHSHGAEHQRITFA